MLVSDNAGSDECWQKLLEVHSEKFVHTVYRSPLGRDADPSGLATYRKVLTSPGGLGEFLSSIIQSEEFAKRAVKILTAHAVPLSYKEVERLSVSGEDVSATKIVFLHLPKTGGTTLHYLLLPYFEISSFCPERFNNLHLYPAGLLAHYRLFREHFDLLSVRLIPDPKKIIMMLREPVSRLVSLYYFPRAHQPEIIERDNLVLPRLAQKYRC